jgi:hypothetical protein
MAIHSSDHLQTMAYTYQEICQGEEPWVALGNFMNAWFGYAQDRRSQLVEAPAHLPAKATRTQQRWAAFSAASVEWLCVRYQVSCPQWVYDSCYTLPESWWYAVGSDRSNRRRWLIAHTPEPFTRRNIYCGNRMYENKYELEDLTAKLKEIRAKKVLTSNYWEQ